MPATVASPSPLRGDADCVFHSPDTVGVGSHDLSIVSRLGLLGCPNRPAEPPWFEPYDDALGVGSCDPETAASMRGAERSCAESRPLRIEPELGKVGQHSAQLGRAQSWHVLDDDDGRHRFADDARVVGPEVALVCGSKSLAGDAVGLARESAADHANVS